MDYTTMIFDIDGTLTDSASAILRALKQAVFEITGQNYEEGELSFALGVPSHIAMEQLTGDRWQEAMAAGQKYYLDELKRIRLFPEIETTVKKLHKKGTQLGIVTSKSRAEFERSFYRYSVSPYFSHVICQDDTPFHKPNPEPLLKCMELLHAKPDSVLYIGDTLSDSRCAKNAGAAFALAGWGCPDSSKIPADIYLSSPAELLSM